MTSCAEVQVAGPWPKACVLVSLALVLLALLAYRNTFRVPFLLDDHVAIRRNATVTEGRVPAVSNRMLVEWSFVVNHRLGGLDVRGYHAVNLLLHILAGLSLYGWLIILCERVTRGGGRGMAACVTGAWLLHPLQTGAVTYLCQRYEVMMGLCFFLTLWLAALGFRAGGGSRTEDAWRGDAWFLLMIGVCSLGMLTKQTMALAPLLVLLMDRVFFAGGWRAAFRQHGRVYAGLLIPWLVLAVVSATWVQAVIRGGISTVSARELSARAYAAAQPEIILHYVRLALWPTGQCFDYDWPPVSAAADVLLPGAVLLLLALVTVVALVRGRPAGFWGAWFFLLLAPTSGLVLLDDLAFEHRMYLPLLAIVVGVVYGGARVLDAVRMRPATRAGVRRGLAVALLVILAIATWRRNGVFASETDLWFDTVRKAPHNLRAINNLGVAYARQGRFDEALAALTDVVARTDRVAPVRERIRLAQLSPAANRVRALANCGQVMADQQQYAEAADYYTQALNAYPFQGEVYAKLRDVLIRSGMTPDEAERQVAERLAVILDGTAVDHSDGQGCGDHHEHGSGR